MGRVAQLPGGLPRRVLGLEERIELPVRELDVETPEELSDHARVLDLVERARDPEQRQGAVGKGRRRPLVAGKVIPVERGEAGLPPGLDERLVPCEVEEGVA